MPEVRKKPPELQRREIDSLSTPHYPVYLCNEAL